MGRLNLIQGAYEGRLGQTVGAKWKDKKTVRSYAVPADPKTQAQQTVRSVFGQIASFTSLFTDQIKYLTSLDTKGQSVRNAIIKLNKAEIDGGTFDAATLQINKGGLPNVTAFTATATATAINCTFTAPVATNITAKAKCVVVVANNDEKIAIVGEGLLNTGKVDITYALPTGKQFEVYYWVIDYRSSSRVGSVSGHTTVTRN